MTDIRIMSDTEIGQRVIWLENEINICLEYDLPTFTFENELMAVIEVLEMRSVN